MGSREKMDLDLEALVDELGAVQVRLQEVRQQEQELKRRIVMLDPPDHVVGQFWECVLITTTVQARVAWKQVALAMKPPKRIVDKYTETIEPVTQFRMFPREV